MRKITLLIVTTFVMSMYAYSQDVLMTVDEMNSVFKKENHPNKTVKAYASLRQADVMWSRTIWREIDLRKKINHPFYYPENNGIAGAAVTADRKSLIDVIYTAITEGSITAYDNAAMDDEFREPMTQDGIKRIGGAKQEYVESTDWDKVISGELTEEEATIQKLEITPFDRNTIKKWRLKETWFFDKQRSVMDVRILGICPLQEGKDEVTGRLNGTYNPLFWVYFPEAREILVNAEAFNLMKNDAERRTYDDIFWKRMFSSTITEEANVYDRKVNEFMIGLDALLEAERIKTEIFNIEHDLWEY